MQPWDKWDSEGASPFAAFVAFRDIGSTRTVSKAAKLVGKSPSTLAKWADRWRWTDRAHAWDRDQDRIRREAHNAEIAEMAKRQARLGVLAQMKAQQRFAKIDADKLTVKEATNLARIGVTIERTARGEPTEIVRQDGKTEHVIGTVEQWRNVPIEKLTLLDDVLADILAVEAKKPEAIEQKAEAAAPSEPLKVIESVENPE